MRLRYRCPGCRTTSNLHDPGCEFEGTDRRHIEKAYTDLLGPLSIRDYDDEDALREAVPERWSGLHAAVFRRLKSDQRVVEEDGSLRLLAPEAYRDRVSRPTFEPLQTIYESGSVPGAHDHSVFAMIAFYEMVGLSWEEARENTIEWLEESGTWARGGFEESSPGELVDSKKHVFEEGYGWKQAATEAKAVIDRRVS
ncbi:DUF7474 family protein [Natronomonas sp.]|uniref:DUF7474 family protein n=1 Tax=Natronomonas sp. TaxID=2184060 RepID=UPI00262D0BF1|nr:hypothetical protein [Natronomonas sp.]